METNQPSRSQFCRDCNHNRSAHGDGGKCLFCTCRRYLFAFEPTSPKLVEPSPNARARDAAVSSLKVALAWPDVPSRARAEIRAALVCLEEIS